MDAVVAAVVAAAEPCRAAALLLRLAGAAGVQSWCFFSSLSGEEGIVRFESSTVLDEFDFVKCFATSLCRTRDVKWRL
jgi:hypothetical protein